MRTTRFQNERRRRARLIWACTLGLASALPNGVLGQDAVRSTETPRALALAVRGENTTPSEEISVREREKQQPIVLLAVAGVPDAKPEGGAIRSGSTNQAPTYLRDILPILMGKCSRCHNDQARFVYNWLDYRTAFADRWEIRRRVWDSWNGSYYKESMPIANSPESLTITEEERLTIRNWVIDGGLRGIAPPPGGPKSKTERIELGKRLFDSICAACHQPTGQGLPNVFPPLAGSDFLNADKNRAIKIVINGRQGQVIVNGQKFNNTMPKFPLADDDIANVLTFVYSSFGNAGLEVKPDEVKLLRSEPPDVEGPKAPPNPFE